MRNRGLGEPRQFFITHQGETFSISRHNIFVPKAFKSQKFDTELKKFMGGDVVFIQKYPKSQ